MNASGTADVHLVQMWVVPDTDGIPPGYEQRDLNDALPLDAHVSSARPVRVCNSPASDKEAVTLLERAG